MRDPFGRETPDSTISKTISATDDHWQQQSIHILQFHEKTNMQFVIEQSLENYFSPCFSSRPCTTGQNNVISRLLFLSNGARHEGIKTRDKDSTLLNPIADGYAEIYKSSHVWWKRSLNQGPNCIYAFSIRFDALVITISMSIDSIHLQSFTTKEL